MEGADTGVNIATQIVSMALLAVSVGMIFWRNGYFQALRPGQVAPVSLVDVLMLFGVYLATQLVLIPAVLIGIHYMKTGRVFQVDELSEAAQGWMQVVAITGGALALYGASLCLRKDKNRLIWNRQNKTIQAFWKDYGLGAATVLLAYPVTLTVGEIVNAFILEVLHIEPHDQVAVRYFRLTTPHPVLMLAMGLLIIVVVPTVEEFLFRGCLQSWLRQIFGAYVAIPIASGVFALFHYSGAQGATNASLLLSLFVLGCFLGYLYERQGSLWTSIALHSSFNMVSILMILLLDS